MLTENKQKQERKLKSIWLFAYFKLFWFKYLGKNPERVEI